MLKEFAGLNCVCYRGVPLCTLTIKIPVVGKQVYIDSIKERFVLLYLGPSLAHYDIHEHD